MQLELGLPSNVKVEKETDSIGGGGFIVDTGIYSGKIEVAFLDYAESGAMSVNIHFNTGKQVIKRTVYISNKKGEFTYKDKQSGADMALPGYTEMTAFFQALTGKDLNSQVTEEKSVKIWDSKAKAELPKKVQVFREVTGQAIACGILKVSEEKTVKDNNNNYVGTGDFRDVNEFNKWFDPESGLTNVEKAAGESDPIFAKKWKETQIPKEHIRKAKNQPKPGTATAGAPAGSEDNPGSLFD